MLFMRVRGRVLFLLAVAGGVRICRCRGGVGGVQVDQGEWVAVGPGPFEGFVESGGVAEVQEIPDRPGPVRV